MVGVGGMMHLAYGTKYESAEMPPFSHLHDIFGAHGCAPNSVSKVVCRHMCNYSVPFHRGDSERGSCMAGKRRGKYALITQMKMTKSQKENNRQAGREWHIKE